VTGKLIHLPPRVAGAAKPAASADVDAGVISRQQIIEGLGAGSGPRDSDFDAFLPEGTRAVSGQHWTPVRVAARAAEWFEEMRVRTVLDIGSGAGKFCVAAALAGNAEFVGVEHRSDLVRAARSLARDFGVEQRVKFVDGALGAVTLPQVDAYYLYNPFEENISHGTERIALDVELSVERYQRDLAATRRLLGDARLGSFVLVYNGFGGELPPGYRQVRTDRDLPHPLRLWRKTTWIPSGRGLW
jgi:SAM-dependent methyltransferase